MNMVNWANAIERNREALLRIVEALVAMAGLAEGATAPTLPRHLRNYLLRILRPAESAARRLIVIASRGMSADLHPTRAVGRTAAARRRRAGREPKDRTGNPLPLLDPLPRFDLRPRHRRPKGFPRISIIGVTEPRPIPDNWIPSPDDPVGAAGLCRRLSALRRALENIDAGAQRLARWRAKCDLGLSRSPRFSPLKPGRPPGHRKRPLHAVDEILRECHALALYAMRAPDTS